MIFNKPKRDAIVQSLTIAVGCIQGNMDSLRQRYKQGRSALTTGERNAMELLLSSEEKTCQHALQLAQLIAIQSDQKPEDN